MWTRAKATAYALAWQRAHPKRLRRTRRRYYLRNRKKILRKGRAYRKAHPRIVRKINRKKRLKAVYGMTPEQYTILLHRQKGRCAICRRRPMKNSLSVDHCHTTGTNRGLLCARCNRGIGLFWDDPKIFLRVAIYLGKQARRRR